MSFIHGYQDTFYLPGCTRCNMMPVLTVCLPIQIHIMNQMVRVMQSCLCDRTHFAVFAHYKAAALIDILDILFIIIVS